MSNVVNKAPTEKNRDDFPSLVPKKYRIAVAKYTMMIKNIYFATVTQKMLELLSVYPFSWRFLNKLSIT